MKKVTQLSISIKSNSGMDKILKNSSQVEIESAIANGLKGLFVKKYQEITGNQIVPDEPINIELDITSVTQEADK